MTIRLHNLHIGVHQPGRVQPLVTDVSFHLDEGETTVGTHICVSHAKAVNVGDSVVVSCELTERDRRRLTFRVGVRHGEAVVSEGTHERFVVGP